MVRGLVFGLAVAAVAVVGCGGGSDDGDDATGDVCEVGAVEWCACPAREMGIRSCVDNGSKWSECACPDAAPTTPEEGCRNEYEPGVDLDRCTDPGFPRAFMGCGQAAFDAGICAPHPNNENLACCVAE